MKNNIDDSTFLGQNNLTNGNIIQFFRQSTGNILIWGKNTNQIVLTRKECLEVALTLLNEVKYFVNTYKKD